MTRTPSLILLHATLLAASAWPQAVTLPPGMPLPVRITKRVPMKAGKPLRGELLYPVYAGDTLILPAGTAVAGSIVSLSANPSRRTTARLRGDFTPYHNAVVNFTAIVAPDGSETPISTRNTSDGAPVYRIVRQPAAKGGFVGQYFRIFLGYVDDFVENLVAPDKAGRLGDFLLGQLPIHPERIAAGTAWTVETAEPLTITKLAAPPPPPTPREKFHILRAKSLPESAPASAHGEPPTWVLQAYLDQGISSETSAPNQPIRATVAEPVLNADGSVAVPVGAVLSGTVREARPARRFDRAGVLRFSFTELQLPDQPAQRVRTTLAAADASGGAKLDMDSEGEVKPQAKDKVIVPLLLVLLATRPLDSDGREGGDNHTFGKDAVASGSLGLISFIVGTAARNVNFAAGLGAYSAALSIYPRFFGKGTAVSFPKDTRIVLQTTATQSTQLKAAATER